MPSVAQMLRLGFQEHQAGNLSAAERNYRSIIRVDPRQPEALHLLGVVHQQRGDAKSAADYIRRAIIEQPQSAAFHSNLAASHVALGDLNAACVCLTESVRLDPKFAEAQYNLGVVLDNLGRGDEAAAAFQQASALDPGRNNPNNKSGALHPVRSLGKDHDRAVPLHMETTHLPDPRESSHWPLWLADNASLRWDPEMTCLPASRCEYMTERYAFARDLCAGRIVLDVGCGTGYGSNMLGEAASTVCGVDICAEAVEFATRKYGSDRIRFQRCYAESLPFDTNAFDAITCFEALEHLLSPRSALQEIVRVLAPDGLAVVSVPNAWGYTEHHFVDTDLQFLKAITAELFEETHLYYNNSAGFRAHAPTGIGPLADIDPSIAECLLAVCRKPREVIGAKDRIAALLDDAYGWAIKRHAAFSELSKHSYGPLPTKESTDSLPQIQPGSRLSLETETAAGPLKQVVLRMEADVLACEPHRATVLIPPMQLRQPTVAQFHILYDDHSIGTCPPVCLMPDRDAV